MYLTYIFLPLSPYDNITFFFYVTSTVFMTIILIVASIFRYFPLLTLNSQIMLQQTPFETMFYDCLHSSCGMMFGTQKHKST